MRVKTVIFDATEAVCPERRGIGVQMRSWLESAPYTDYPWIRFILANRTTPDREPLGIDAPNVKEIALKTASEEAYIDRLYGLNGDLLFFPLASQKFIRKGPTEVVGVDYGMEDVYCRNYIAPRPVSEMLRWHESALKHYTSVITVSKNSQRDLTWFFPEYRHKIHVIYPGSPTIHSHQAHSLPVELKSISYFLVVGYELKKNIIRIAAAFDRFK